MRSKTSFFNGTLFKKNLTRFSPVWILYTLCLLLGLFVTYTNYTPERRIFWFAANLAEDVTSVLSVVNLGYGLLVAQLLFGDLYNSRMCNAIHAFPIRREGWLMTNLVSGLVFSLVPTAIMALIALPLLSNSIFADAWMIPFLVFTSANLEFLCFFGIAVFCAMCVGNRFTMIAAYGLINFGAYLAYIAVDILYEPLMYGFITPSEPFEVLTPIVRMLSAKLYELTDFIELQNILNTTKVPLSTLTAAYTLGEDWGILFLWAGVGLAMMAASVLLYRRRQLECAGDPVAFRCLVPVFQVLCSLFVSLMGYCFTDSLLNLPDGYQVYLFLTVGLAVGWFLARMMIERTTRVFRLKNLPGLGILLIVMVLTFVGTHFDVLGIQRRVPDLQEVESIDLSSGDNIQLTEEAEIQEILRLHQLALANPNEDTGLYLKGHDGTYIRWIDTNDQRYDSTQEQPDFTYVTRVNLSYTLKNGSSLRRSYNIWTESEEGDITRKYMSSWRAISNEWMNGDGELVSQLAETMKDFRYLSVPPMFEPETRQINDAATARSFLEAVQADCAAGTLAQNQHFHKDAFRLLDPPKEEDADTVNLYESFYVTIRGEYESWHLSVYPDCENILRWLTEHDLMDYEVVPNTCAYWSPAKD